MMTDAIDGDPQFHPQLTSGLTGFAEILDQAFELIKKAERAFIVAAVDAQASTAMEALDYERARPGGWDSRDVSRVRRLAVDVGDRDRLTAEDRTRLEAASNHHVRGRPRANGGPKTAVEHLQRLWDWSQMPAGTRSERLAQIRKSPWYRRILAEVYRSEYERLRTLGRGELSLHEAAEEAVSDVFCISPANLRLLKSNLHEDVNDLALLAKYRRWIEFGGPRP